MILTLTEEQKKHIVETVIRRLKEGATLSEAGEVPNPNVRMVNFEDPNDIDRYINDVYAIFQASYANIGGFLGTRDANAA
ncbi:MAG: hypothetical protein LUD72_12895 [Bacteroidales bacterium]|nr:hypothetical protein [Bacteroidales bacterium]